MAFSHAETDVSKQTKRNVTHMGTVARCSPTSNRFREAQSVDRSICNGLLNTKTPEILAHYKRATSVYHELVGGGKVRFKKASRWWHVCSGGGSRGICGVQVCVHGPWKSPSSLSTLLAEPWSLNQLSGYHGAAHHTDLACTSSVL